MSVPFQSFRAPAARQWVEGRAIHVFSAVLYCGVLRLELSSPCAHLVRGCVPVRVGEMLWPRVQSTPSLLAPSPAQRSWFMILLPVAGRNHPLFLPMASWTAWPLCWLGQPGATHQKEVNPVLDLSCSLHVCFHCHIVDCFGLFPFKMEVVLELCVH